MRPNNTVITQIDIHQNDVDLRCTNAIKSGNYALITKLINDGSLDPNEVIDVRRRFYPPRIHKVFADPNDENGELHWSLPQCVDRDSSPEDSTILHEAIAQNNESLVLALLASNKTNPNQKSERGYTPLHYAAIIGNSNIVKALIKNGADPTITCNGFKPIELVSRNKKALKALLSNESQGEQLLSVVSDFLTSILPDFLSESLVTSKKNKSPEHLNPGDGQFGILSKMRAMREGDEVIYANSRGVCCGMAYTAMFFILSNNRDEQGKIVGLTELEYVLRHITTSSLEDFIEKIVLREHEQLLVYQEARDSVNEMDDNAITIELDNLLKSGIIDLTHFTKAASPSEKKTLLIKTNFDLLMPLHFSKEALYELRFRSFLDAVEILHEIEMHAELQREEQPISLQIVNAVFPLLMTPELEKLGGLSKPITLSGVFLQKNAEDKNELEIYFKCLRSKFENLNFPVALQLHANAHAISVFYDPIQKYWIFIDSNRNNPSQPIVMTAENTDIAKRVYDALKFGHEGKPGLSPVKPFIIMETEIYTAKKYEAGLKQQLSFLHDNEEFQALFDVTEFKALATDNNNQTWLDFAAHYGEIEAVKMLHQQHAYENQDPVLNVYYAEYMAKTREQYAHYYLQQDSYKNYTYRYELMDLAHSDKGLQHKFILEVLKNTSIGQTGIEDEANITQSILSCYAQWLYQGRDIEALLSDKKLAALIQKAMINQPNFILNINNTVKQDNELSVRIRQAIHELEKAPVDEASIAFLTDCLITAGRLATTNALSNISGGVLDKAIENVYQQFQRDRGEIPNEKIYNALNSAAFFESHTHTTIRKNKDNKVNPRSPK